MQANHVRCLNDFVTQQIEFYNQCYRHMLNLQREISYANNSHRASSFSASTDGAVGGSSVGVHYPNLGTFNSHLPGSGVTGSVTANTGSTTLSVGGTSPVPATATISPTNSSVLSTSAHLEQLSIRSPSDEILPADLQLPDGKRRARCLNDYKASNSTELTLRANEVILVSYSSDLDPEWMLGERTVGVAPEKGKVPVAYLEILN